MSKFKKLITTIALVASFNAFSVGGAYEINQACVATGCFPGDTAGFPVTLANEGNYILTSNLILSNASDNAISVSSDNVSIDLQGFTIKGINICTGALADCTNSDPNGHGIVSSNNTVNISIKNGSVIGMGHWGISLGQQCSIENIRTEHNGRSGIKASMGCKIVHSIANLNGYIGIEAGQSNVIESSAFNNGEYGIALESSLVTRVTSSNNTSSGIYDWYGSTIVNSVLDNNSQGVWSANGATKIIDSSLGQNSGVAIFHQGGTVFDSLSVPVTIKGNTINLNNGGSDNAQFGGTGAIVEIGTNFCGRDTVCN